MSTENVRNILAIYEQSTSYDVSQGKAWYSYALSECQALAREFGQDISVIVAATAALSPNLKWENNIKGTRNVLLGHYYVPGAYGTNVKKARTIIETGNLDILRGNKVTSFALNILGDTEKITADTWAWRIWKNADYFAKPPSLDKIYDQIEADYQQAAAEVGLEPRQLQAITWVTIRRLANGRTSPGQLSLDI